MTQIPPQPAHPSRDDKGTPRAVPTDMHSTPPPVLTEGEAARRAHALAQWHQRHHGNRPGRKVISMVHDDSAAIPEAQIAAGAVSPIPLPAQLRAALMAVGRSCLWPGAAPRLEDGLPQQPQAASPGPSFLPGTAGSGRERQGDSSRHAH